MRFQLLIDISLDQLVTKPIDLTTIRRSLRTPDHTGFLCLSHPWKRAKYETVHEHLPRIVPSNDTAHTCPVAGKVTLPFYLELHGIRS